MSAANETPRMCPTHFGTHKMSCRRGCGTHCVVLSPETVNADLAAERARREEAEARLKEAREAIAPFAKIAVGNSGRIQTERLSAENWHNLWKIAAIAAQEAG